MIPIIKERQSPSFAEQLGTGLQQTIPQAFQAYGEMLKSKEEARRKGSEREYLENLLGEGAGDLPPDVLKVLLNAEIKGTPAAESKQLAAAEQGLETIKRQKERLATGHLGPKFSIFPFKHPLLKSEAREVRAGYEQAGKELIQLASTLPIRNRAEFEVLAHKLYDTKIPQSEIKGILDEMEHHIQDTIDSLSSKKGMRPKKQKITLTNDIIDALLDETNGDIRAAKKLAADRGYTW